MNPVRHFSGTYVEARDKFFAAAKSQRMAVSRHIHPAARGAAGEELSIGVTYAGMALEYGTLSLRETLHALRADQWLTNHPDADTATRTAIKRQVREAFYCDTDDWKATVYAQARIACVAALSQLGARHA